MSEPTCTYRIEARTKDGWTGDTWSEPIPVSQLQEMDWNKQKKPDVKNAQAYRVKVNITGIQTYAPAPSFTVYRPSFTVYRPSDTHKDSWSVETPGCKKGKQNE